MGLKSPSDIGRCDQDDSLSPVSGRADKIMDSPVFQHKAEGKHDQAESVVDDGRINETIFILCPYVFQQGHR